MTSGKPRRPDLRAAPRLLLLAALVLASGCATYGYAARTGAPDSTQLPIDRMTPESSLRWSYFWGLKHDLWSPLRCTQTDARGACVATLDPCAGRGAGLVEASLPWYAVPLAVVTLGMAIPSRLTIYCSTETPPGTGP